MEKRGKLVMDNVRLWTVASRAHEVFQISRAGKRLSGDRSERCSRAADRVTDQNDLSSEFWRRLGRRPGGAVALDSRKVRLAHLQSRRQRSREERQWPPHFLPLPLGQTVGQRRRVRN